MRGPVEWFGARPGNRGGRQELLAGGCSHRSPARLRLASLLVLLISACTEPEPEAYRLLVADDGVYRVRYEDLVGAGLRTEPASRSLALTRGGEDVPIWVDDGDDGHFSAGDSFEFIGQHLAGDDSTFDPYSRHNVYRLVVSDVRSANVGRRRMASTTVTPETSKGRPRRTLFRDLHWEEEKLRARFSNQLAPKPERWYWARLTHVDAKPFEHQVDLSDIVFTSPDPVSLRLDFRGWSYPKGPRSYQLADHRVEVLWNDTVVGAGEWDDQTSHRIEIEIPTDLLRRGKNRLQLKVPRRLAEPGGEAIIDVVLLNWIELSYACRPKIEDGVTRLRLPPDSSRDVQLLTADEDPLLVFGLGGSRMETRPSAIGKVWRHRFTPGASDAEVYATKASTELPAPWIEADVTSSWRQPSNRADYLMITHPSLRSAVEPLARFHRRRGLGVAVVNVDDIYDEFRHGVAHPEAIRDFVAYAYQNWQKPAPRFVLLVGDASWDPGGQPTDVHYADWTYRPGEKRRFGKNTSTPYGASSAQRNLIPTWLYDTFEGPAASDNYFVAVAGDDVKPELAIGRFPVTEPDEVSAIVDKTIRYLELEGESPWQRHILWITNEAKGFQRRSDKLAKEFAERGFTATKIYPDRAEPNNLEHQAKLRAALDEGQLLVHFLGHGGRYIWRTGPPDFRKDHDLFTLEDLEQLTPSDRLPVVLSMTCYSAPFDHPTADSIGEKFLRLPNRGAVAVFAASWRNSPHTKFSEAVLSELVRPDVRTVGEAIMRAKQGKHAEMLVATYNLLGDPALELALPESLRLKGTVDPPAEVASLGEE